MAVDKVIIDRRLCLTEDRTRVVADTHPDAAFLWAIPGHVVSRAEALRLGALDPDSPAEDADADPDVVDAPPKRKPGRPPGSKNRTPTENK